MDIKEFAKRVHQTAVEKGWWDEGVRTSRLPECLLNIHSEISEASEEARKGYYFIYYPDARYEYSKSPELGKP